MAAPATQKRVQRLEQHLKQENPVLASAVASFQKLDRIQRHLGLMGEDESLATQVSWWPVVSIVGTFSAGKSTFINQFVGQNLQRTGNQAVDDKFTVICYSGAEEATALPGLALDSDPRFPFYQIGRQIEQVAEGEGRRVDSYLQLKTIKAEALRGKILIDSPGFDADQQRTSTLHIIDHIMDLSDIVLVFFDARHPEPGAMVDTLNHLVSNTVNRPDANKFLFILNQMDNTVREDNPEEVVAAWQRALAQHNLTAGRFYRIYSRDITIPVEDEEVRHRMARKRDEDLAEIEGRIRQIEVDRAYRVIGVLEKRAKYIENVLVPALEEARQRWRRRTIWLSGGVIGFLLLAAIYGSVSAGLWDGFVPAPLAGLDFAYQVGAAGVVLIVLFGLHMQLRRIAGGQVLRKIRKDESLGADQGPLARAFEWNIKGWWRSLVSETPRGWNGRRKKQIDAVLSDADLLVQSLNDRYATPSGKR